MTINTDKDYWISSSALYIELNALGNPDYIQASTIGGAKILVYVKDIISYDAGHNYRRWSLQASPTVFGDHTAKYVYAAIPRDMQSTDPALIVFPSEQVDIYGKNSAEEQIGSTDYYYIYLHAIISSSGDNGTINRQWTQRVSTGYLSSDEAIAAGTTESPWYKYSTVDGITTFLKDLTMKAGTMFYDFFAKHITVKSGGDINFEDGGTLTGIAGDGDKDAEDKIMTPFFGNKHYLSKTDADTAAGKITFDAGIRVNDKATFGNYASGLAGFGGQITEEGDAELESLTLRRFLEVPELRYNRVSIQVGNRWRAPGGGIIESVTPDSDSTGIITLHLEEGEIGKIAVDDICQGIWHDGMTKGNNDSDDYDDGIGNFKFAGFYTTYFRITEILETGSNSKFRYALRPTSTTWTATHHPHEAMHFVCYGNFSDTDRQSCRYSTLTYERYLKDVANWEFTQEMIAAQFGDLSNLSIFGIEMKGYSAYLQNIYMSGVIEQFENLGRRMQIDQSLQGYMAPGETETVTVTILDGYMADHTKEYTFKVERDTGDTAADAVWNAEPAHLNCGSVFPITWNDLHISEAHGGISTLFYVTADNGNDTVTTAIEY